MALAALPRENTREPVGNANISLSTWAANRSIGGEQTGVATNGGHLQAQGGSEEPFIQRAMAPGKEIAARLATGAQILIISPSFPGHGRQAELVIGGNRRGAHSSPTRGQPREAGRAGGPVVAPKFVGQLRMDRQLAQLTPAQLPAAGRGAVATAAAVGACAHPGISERRALKVDSCSAADHGGMPNHRFS